MTDTEKVLNGLEQCLMSDDLEAWETQCADCPYCEGRRNHNECKGELLDDALALIREQQKRLKAQTPVKHGRWIDGKVRHIKNGELRNMRECSECGALYFVYDEYNSKEDKPKYCPNCGAIMDKEEDDARLD